MTLDHLIAVVPDLGATHRRLRESGFDEAWPPGPFWPAATTSGIALGGVNLELIQPDSGTLEPRIETLVLAPASLEEGRRMVEPFGFDERDKIEPDPELLALRGFPPEMRAMPQTICRNLYPTETAIAYPFFLCQYAPFLKDRLAPTNFAEPRGAVSGLALVAPDPEAVRRLFAGRLGPIELDVDFSASPGVAALHFADGSSLSAQEL